MYVPSDAALFLSRLQFAFTAIFHFLFVPLTLGLTWILVVMEGCYLVTKKEVYKDMTRFWGKLLAINFAMGVVTGVTMEFEFGTNWAYFSRFSGDAFGTVLAVEGITAFMLEASLIGLFLFGWDRINKHMHWLVTIGVAIGSNLSVTNILVANSWMQHPVVGTTFDYQTMHVSIKSLWDLYIYNLAQVRVAHTMLAGLMVASMFVIGISAYYLLKKRDTGFAARSMAIGIGVGVAAVICVGFFGDQNGLMVAKYEPDKMAAIEAVWNEPKAPAPWSIIAFPSQKHMKNYFDIKIPYGLSIIATHSLDGTIPGEKQIMAQDRPKILSGLLAYQALEQIRRGNADSALVAQFEKNKYNMGYGLLLHQYDPSMATPTATQLDKAVHDVYPEVWIPFWSFRIMILCWILMILLLAWGFYYLARGTIHKHPWWLRLCLWGIPLPWIACEFGWITAEVGRQPWVLRGLLPTTFGASSIDVSTVAFSLGGFVLFYVTLVAIELFLMFKFARMGPSSLGEKRYHHEIPSKYDHADRTKK
jgi:cytochrome bd ubiquinol oxidase subunit I